MLSRKIIICIFITALTIPRLFAQENELYTEEEIPAAELSKGFSIKDLFNFTETLHPEKTTETPAKNSVEIKTNAKNVKVYLNGVYKGLTPISITGLEPGVYRLRLEKEGFLSTEKYISVSKGVSYSYYYEMSEIKGFVEVRGIPNSKEFMIFADGNRIYSPFFELPEGPHRIQIRSFGYEDFFVPVYVRRHRIKRISIKMQKAQFKITDFYASRKTINPEYSGSLGNCTLTAKVSAPGTGHLSVKNMLDQEVFYTVFPGFSTWEQNATWDGRDSSGNTVPSGKYTATFYAEGQTAVQEISVDRTMIFPLSDLTSGGTGNGFLTTASILPKGTKLLNFSVAPVSGSKNGFYAAPVYIGFADSVFNQLELSCNLALWAGITDTPLLFSVAAKFADKTKNENHIFQFRYGAAARYGVCDASLFPDYGADSGCGLGLSGFMGLCSAKFCADISSEFIFGAETSNPLNGDNSWKNGISFTFSPVTEFSAKLSCALISNSDYFDAIQPKAGFSFLIPGTSFVFNADFYGIIYFDSPYYLGGTAGFGYLF